MRMQHSLETDHETGHLTDDSTGVEQSNLRSCVWTMIILHMNLGDPENVKDTSAIYESERRGTNADGMVLICPGRSSGG